jgi:signal transduction histidine kinase
VSSSAIVRPLATVLRTTFIWRWAATILALTITFLRPDLPTAPVILLAIYMLATTGALYFVRPRRASSVVAVTDIAALSLCVLYGGGERSLVYIVYVTTMLDMGARFAPRHAAALSIAAALSYWIAVWAASSSDAGFDSSLAATRGFLAVAVAMGASSLSTVVEIERRRSAESQALGELMRLALAAALDLHALLPAVVAQVCAGLHADVGVVCILGDDGKPADVASCGLEQGQHGALREALTNDDACRQSVSAGQALGVTTTAGAPPMGLAAVLGDVRSIAYAPLMLEQETVGRLAIARRGGASFVQADLHLLWLMAQHAALAVHNARLHMIEKSTVAELRAAEQAKTDFLAMVSHELRTPLTAIRASAGLLMESQPGDLTANQQRLTRSIVRNSDRLTSLVTDLLDMGRLEHGQLTLTCELTDIRAVVRSCLALMQPLTEQKSQTLTATIAPDAPRVIADRKRIEQVLTNLLANAHRYTPEGGRLSVSAVNDDGALRVTVQDDGPGVPEHERAHIFDRFYRGAVERTANQPGAGLGLAIAKSLVELHGGTIGYEAAAAGGSAFWFVLPSDGPNGAT